MCNNMPERDDDFEQMLDECYPKVKIGDIEFFPSDILFECDPIAYRVYLGEYKDGQCQDGYHTSEKGETCDWCSEPMKEEEE